MSFLAPDLGPDVKYEARNCYSGENNSDETDSWLEEKKKKEFVF